jgi:hypothetical protein
MQKNWFDVDRKGLAKLIERRGKIALLFELVGNALDADGVTTVEVVLEPVEGVPHVEVTVSDDAPDGFTNMSHAWTLFAESSRKSYANKRGRFNLGEKLVLALCNEASIISTKDAVMFDARGRTTMKARRPRGTEFYGIARITRTELAEITLGLRRLIVPEDVTIIVNTEKIPTRKPIKTVEATLATEIADEDGNLKRSTRKTTVNIYEPLPGETAYLYEMGIPVVETGDRWHVDVQQKIPLNMDRDNVTPAYLRDVRTLVVNALHEQLSPDDANATFLNEALADENATPETVAKALDLKYGEKRAIFDPNDAEANMNLTSQGYTLIKGAQLTKEQWTNVKKHDSERTKPAGQIAPTKKARFSPDGVDRWVPREKWTANMVRVINYTRDVATELLGAPVAVNVLSDVTESYAACFGDLGFVFNLGRLGHKFFDRAMNEYAPNDEAPSGSYRPSVELNQLIIHELGHHFEHNHLDEKYHEALCDLGARMVKLALTRPTLFYRGVN